MKYGFENKIEFQFILKEGILTAPIYFSLFTVSGVPSLVSTSVPKVIAIAKLDPLKLPGQPLLSSTDDPNIKMSSEAVLTGQKAMVKLFIQNSENSIRKKIDIGGRPKL